MTEKQIKDSLKLIRAELYKLEQHFVEEEMAKAGGPSPRPRPTSDPVPPPQPSPHQSPHPSPHPSPQP